MLIGIDLGGTKTEIICLNDQNGKELYRQRVPSPTNDYKATVKNMAAMLHRAEETVGERAPSAWVFRAPWQRTQAALRTQTPHG